MTTQAPRAALSALLGLLGGCAHMPEVTVGYYLAESTISFKVVRTVACDADNRVIVANATTPTVTHSADRSRLIQVRLDKLKGTFSDTDIKFEFLADGRLKGVNATNTGQGEAALKTVATIATAAMAITALREPGTPREPLKAECDLVKSVGAGKPITLTYEGVVDLGRGPRDKQDIPPDTASEAYAKALAKSIGTVFAVVEGNETSRAPATYEAHARDVLLTARQPGMVTIKVMTGAAKGFEDEKVWQGKLPAAQLGTTYSVPIPGPTTFGKLNLAASFEESGAISSLQYAANTGTVQALNATGAALTTMQGETTAQKAADVKAEADLIAQQQRLVQCLADPRSCK